MITPVRTRVRTLYHIRKFSYGHTCDSVPLLGSRGGGGVVGGGAASKHALVLQRKDGDSGKELHDILLTVLINMNVSQFKSHYNIK